MEKITVIKIIYYYLLFFHHIEFFFSSQMFSGMVFSLMTYKLHLEKNNTFTKFSGLKLAPKMEKQQFLGNQNPKFSNFEEPGDYKNVQLTKFSLVSLDSKMTWQFFIFQNRDYFMFDWMPDDIRTEKIISAPIWPVRP